MDSFVKVQIDLSGRINKAKVNFKKSPKERLRSSAYLNTRLEALEELWREFISTHTKIIHSSDTNELSANSYCTNNIYENTEEQFIDHKYELKEALSKLKDIQSDHSSSSDGKNKSSGVDRGFKLPEITIQPFSGNYSEWISFRDIFMSLIHNNTSFDDVQKLHYLKGLLTGEAEQLLRHIPITHDNYVNCWEQLEKRYNNKRYLSNCILKRFMSQKAIVVESASSLKELLDTTNECLYALKNLGIDVSSWDVLVVYIVCQKLDSESRKQWELKLCEISDDMPTFEQFQVFLENRFRALELVDPKLSRSTIVNKSNIVYNPKIHYASTLVCSYCNEHHRLANCKKFSKVTIDVRRGFVKSQGLCFNCLSKGHSVFTCRQTSRCRICKRKHHSLLHSKNGTNSSDINGIANQSVEQDVVAYATISTSSPNKCTNVTSCFMNTQSRVLLATALVNAESKSGNGITLRCLIDPGSQASCITESAVQLLNVKKIPHKSIITGLGSDQGHQLTSKSIVSVKLQSLHDPSFTVKVQAFVLAKLTTILPERQIVYEQWSEFSNINLADPSFHMPNKIDVILGADTYGKILLDGIIKGPPGAPIAQRTSFGWILCGAIHVDENISCQRAHISMHITHINKDDSTNKENNCKQILANTSNSKDSGRYIVMLPLCSSDSICQYKEKNMLKYPAVISEKLCFTHSLFLRFQHLVQDFWRRWFRYLTKFYRRYKWFLKIPELQLGDIVLVMKNDLPPLVL